MLLILLSIAFGVVCGNPGFGFHCAVLQGANRSCTLPPQTILYASRDETCLRRKQRNVECNSASLETPCGPRVSTASPACKPAACDGKKKSKATRLIFFYSTGMLSIGQAG
jgi:hypothetical protein